MTAQRNSLEPIDLTVFDVRWRVVCRERLTYNLVRRNFLELTCPHPPTAPVELISLEAGMETRWSLRRNEQAPIPIADTHQLLYQLEKTITIETQRHRSDLFFLHAAALALKGSAILLIAASGSGKSTTAWALANRGFDYLSDELAPINLATMAVEPYPHALCLKRPPPAPFELPRSIITTAHTFHVPTDQIGSVCRKPVPLGTVFFNHYEASAAEPSATRITASEASALIYSNGLNQLAHKQAGLVAAAKIATAAACYRLTTNDLDRTCALVLATVRSSGQDQTV